MVEVVPGGLFAVSGLVGVLEVSDGFGCCAELGFWSLGLTLPALPCALLEAGALGFALFAAEVSWLAVPVLLPLVVAPAAPVVLVPEVAVDVELLPAPTLFEDVLESGVQASDNRMTSVTWNEPSLAWLPLSCTWRPSLGCRVALSPVTGVL